MKHMTLYPRISLFTYCLSCTRQLTLRRRTNPSIQDKMHKEKMTNTSITKNVFFRAQPKLSLRPPIPPSGNLYNFFNRQKSRIKGRVRPYLIFVIFCHEQNFWRIKFIPKKRVNYDKIHRKLPIVCVITAKYTVNCQFFALNL